MINNLQKSCKYKLHFGGSLKFNFNPISCAALQRE